MITQDFIKDRLDYDPLTGIFVWKVNSRGKHKKGSVAGCVWKDKARNGENKRMEYILIGLGGKLYKAHRLAWVLTHGYIPYEVDHRDGNGTNNSIDNLREATHTQNMWNRGKNKNNKSGFKGVTSHQGKWMSQIRANGDCFKKSGFATPELAYEWYCEKSKELHGEFSRV